MGSEQKGKGVALVVSYQPLGLVRATAWALAGDALHIETGSVALAHCAVVDVLFTAAGQRRGHFHRFQAAVAGTAGGGTALSIHGCPAEVHQALERALGSGDRPARPGRKPLTCHPFP